MRKLTYYVAVTEDGYIAGPNGQFDFFLFNPAFLAWIHEHCPETMPTHLHGTLGTPDHKLRYDTVLMGRATFQLGNLASPYNHLRQYVFSTTLELPGGSPATLVRSSPVETVQRLKQEDGLDIWLCGGGMLAAALYEEIDTLIIKRHPILAGSGIPMFSPSPFRPRLFERVDQQVLDAGITITTLQARPLA